MEWAQREFLDMQDRINKSFHAAVRPSRSFGLLGVLACAGFVAAQGVASPGQGQSGRTAVEPEAPGSGAQSMGSIVPGWPQCARFITDDATGACLPASSVPTLGMLYPISSSLFVDSTSGNVGMGTTFPSEKLQLGEFFTTTDDVFVEMRTVGGGPDLKQGLKMRASNPFFGFDITHDDGLKGLNINRWDNDFGVFGDSALFVDRQTGNLGLGTTNPGSHLEIGTNSSPGDKYMAVRTAGGNQYKAGIKFSHFADDNGFVIESDETFGVNGLNFIHQASGAPESALYISRVTGDVGFGTTAPSDALHVASTGSARLRLEADTDNSNENDHAGIEFSQDNGLETGYVGFNNGNNEFKVQSATNDIDFDTDGVNRMRVTLGGNVGIGTGAPSQLLSVNGSAGKPGGGSWSNFSDRRLKKNIADLDGALDTLLELRGVTFEYKDPEAINELGGERIGFIAQEVEAVLPDWVEEAGDYKMLTIRGFEALTVEALRELRSEVASKDAEIDELRAEVERLRGVTGRVEALESAMHEVLATR